MLNPGQYRHRTSFSIYYLGNYTYVSRTIDTVLRRKSGGTIREPLAANLWP